MPAPTEVAGVVVRVIGLVVSGVFLPRLWPVVRAAAVASHPRLPVLDQAPPEVRRVLGPFGTAALLVEALTVFIRTLMPDVYRSMRVWRRILPIFSAYMWTKYRTDLATKLFRLNRAKVEKRWAARHEKGGRGVHSLITTIKGYYIKSGQILATKREYIPPQWADRLATLWDDTPPRPWRNVRSSILRDLQGTELAAAQKLAEKEEAKARKQGGRNKGKAPSGEQNGTGASAAPQGKSNGPVPLTSAALKQLEAARSPVRPIKPSAAVTQTPGRPPFHPAAAGGTAAGVASNVPRGAASAIGAGDAGSIAGLSTAPSHAWSTAAVAARFLGSLLSTSKPGEGSVAAPGSVAAGAAESEVAGSVRGGEDDKPLFMISATAAAVLEERAKARQQHLPKKGWFLGRRSRGGNSAAQRNNNANTSSIATNGQAPVTTDAAESKVQTTEAGAGGGSSRVKRRGDLVSQWFAEVEEKPLACASIAQVHAATLSPELMQVLGPSWTHGLEVVLKVQHRDVQRLMGTDLRNMGRIARFLRHVLPFDPMPAVREMQEVIPKLMGAIRARLSPLSKSLVVPEPVMPLCSSGLIVMQRMRGTSLTSLLAAAKAGDMAARESARKVITTLLDAYGSMIFEHGLFHADPHPGNLLLQPDGRVALLDWGQVKCMGATERRALCELYLALARQDAVAALKHAAPFGLVLSRSTSSSTAPGVDSTAAGSEGGRTSNSGKQQDASKAAGEAKKIQAAGAAPLPPDPAAALKLLLIMFDTKWIPEGASYSFGGADIVEGVALTGFPQELYLICRAILILRGLCSALVLTDVSAVARWKPYATAGLREAPAKAAARAAENASLDHGLTVAGL